MADFNRRDFLKNTAAGIGSLLVLDTLVAGCSDDTQPPAGDKGVPDGGVPDGSLKDGTTPDAFVTPADMYKDWPTTYTEAVIPTTCWIGKQDCGMLARVLTQTIGGKSVQRIVKLEGNPDHPRNNGNLCPKGLGQLQAIYDFNRVKWPLLRTNAKGQTGTFKKITWTEALAELDKQIQAAKSKSEVYHWQSGRSKAKDFYDTAFVEALKAAGIKVSKAGHGSYCSDSGYRAAEYTLGFHAVIGPDLAQTQYLLSWGWGMLTSGGNKLCWLTWPQKFIKARERTSNPLKTVVCLDPNRRQTGPHADVWLPNRPGSDLAFFLGLANYLVSNTTSTFKNGLIDETYLLKHTNAPFLVGSDGKILRVSSKEQVWDTTTSAAVDYDASGITPALTGSYTVSGQTYKTGFQLYKDHLASYTPTWADGITQLPSGTVAKIAKELFDAAKIGTTITLDGKTLPYRPVSMMAYHISQQEMGFQAIRAAINVFQLLGAIDVPGGIQIDFAPKELYKNWTGLEGISIQTSNLDYQLAKSKFFPICSVNPSFFHGVQLNPTKYSVDTATIPKRVIVHMADPVSSFTDSKVVRDAYKTFTHVTVLSPWMSETADHFADLILPAATLEKYEGPISCSTPDESATALRVPPVSPLWESKGEIDIYLEIAQKSGFLSSYLGQVNKALGTSLPTSTMTTAKAIFDAWATVKGYTGGVKFFETYNATGTKGVTTVSTHTADKKYSGAQDYFKARHRLYGESLLGYQASMKAAAVDKVYYQDYTAFPTWREPTMWGSASKGYTLHLITHKQVEFKQSRASFIPVLAELSPQQGLLINPTTAGTLSITDGGDVTVTSHHALTGETRSIKTKAVFWDAIRPDTVSLSHHYGLTTHPSTKGQGPSPNLLFFSSEGYVQCTNDASFHVMVKVTKG